MADTQDSRPVRIANLPSKPPKPIATPADPKMIQFNEDYFGDQRRSSKASVTSLAQAERSLSTKNSIDPYMDGRT